MSASRKPPKILTSRTGEIPAIENSQLHEPPMPDTLPEFPDANSTTGKFFPIKAEGEDKARLRDDSATSSEYVRVGKKLP
jgi:hypothetical protein